MNPIKNSFSLAAHESVETVEVLAYVEWHEDGFFDSLASASMEGFVDWIIDGLDEVITVGSKDGADVGGAVRVNVGGAVGVDVGCVVGVDVGGVVGVDVGSAVGVDMGGAVGVGVGVSVGGDADVSMPQAAPQFWNILSVFVLLGMSQYTFRLKAESRNMRFISVTLLMSQAFTSPLKVVPRNIEAMLW